MGAVVKRLKVMGNLDIAQQRQTQGGRISLRIGSKEYDLRVSVIPVPSGESVVMRVLKKGAFTLTLSDLGFDKSREDQFRSMLTQPLYPKPSMIERATSKTGRYPPSSNAKSLAFLDQLILAGWSAA